MKCLLLATGEERSLLPLTEHVPAPMLRITDRPVMSYAVELLARYDLNDILVSLYNHADQIEQHFKNGQRWDVNLHYLLQRKSWGDAGAIKRAYRQPTETLLVLPANEIVDLDIPAAVAFHRSHGGPATVILSKPLTKQHKSKKAVELDADGQIHLIKSVATAETGLYLTGAYILEPSVLNLIPNNEPYDCLSQLLPKLFETGMHVYGYQMQGYWNPLDSFEAFQAAQVVFLNSFMATSASDEVPTVRYPYLEASMHTPSVWAGKSSSIHPTARLTPPVYIGRGCRIGRDVELGPNAIINANSIVDTGATVNNSTVLANTYVGKFVDIKDRLVNQTYLIDIHSETKVQITDPFLLTAAGPTVAYNALRRNLEKLLALSLLAFFMPLLLVVGVVLWLTSRQSIFWRVPRVGKTPSPWQAKGGLQVVYLWNFKTYAANGRLTPLGWWIKRWGIYRLPELWNVIKNDIALIGVKPLSPAEADLVCETWQQKRYDFPMGFTGLWYTRTNIDSDFDEICVMDTYQAAIHTWRQDLIQLLITPLVWAKKVYQNRVVAESVESIVRQEQQEMNYYKPSKINIEG